MSANTAYPSQKMTDVMGFEDELKALFTRHNDVSEAIMAKYPSRRAADGCTETAPLSADDQKKFIESRRFLMASLRVELPKMLKKYPAVFGKDLIGHTASKDPHAYAGQPIAVSTKDKFIAVALSFAPGERTPAHGHDVACVSYLLKGGMMEAECDMNGNPIRTIPKRAGETTIVSPHEEAADFNQHYLFSTGTHAQSLLVHVYDCLALTPEGTVKDITGNIKTLQSGILNNITLAKSGGALALRQ